MSEIINLYKRIIAEKLYLNRTKPYKKILCVFHLDIISLPLLLSIYFSLSDLYTYIYIYTIIHIYSYTYIYMYNIIYCSYNLNAY